MSGLTKHNQKLKSQLGGQKNPCLFEDLKAEPPTFSRISILDSEEIFPFLKPLAPRRIRKRACPFSEFPEKPSKKIKQGLSKMPSEEKDHLELLFLTACLLGVLTMGYGLFLGRAVTWLKPVQYGVNRLTT